MTVDVWHPRRDDPFVRETLKLQTSFPDGFGEVYSVRLDSRELGEGACFFFCFSPCGSATWNCLERSNSFLSRRAPFAITARALRRNKGSKTPINNEPLLYREERRMERRYRNENQTATNENAMHGSLIFASLDEQLSLPPTGF